MDLHERKLGHKKKSGYKKNNMSTDRKKGGETKGQE
jgi:hypothetical protein